MVVQGKLMRKLKWCYFCSKWNLLELAIILVSWSALAVFVKRAVLAERDIQHYRGHREEGISFSETAAADAALGYIIAFLVLLSTLKLRHLLRLNPKMNMITSALCRARGDISGFIIVILIMLLAYSITSHLIFGWKLVSYKTLFDAAETIISLQLGIFNYQEVLDDSPVLGSFLVGSCIVFMTFVVLNLFISVILVAFSEEQKYHQLSEEGEIADLLLMKILSFLGIRCKREAPQSSTEKSGELTEAGPPQPAHAAPKVGTASFNRTGGALTSPGPRAQRLGIAQEWPSHSASSLSHRRPRPMCSAPRTSPYPGPLPAPESAPLAYGPIGLSPPGPAPRGDPAGSFQPGAASPRPAPPRPAPPPGA
ncbi:polycystin-1-like protein 2 [Loxodonta africana]|uniref:polycystin-1-like protein 2 n=1 Tax=Loxodonta africana TaxID=9785 RepID=UPI0030CE64B8